MGRWAAVIGAALVALVGLLPGCERLGNPPLDRGETPWAEWTTRGLKLETRTVTVPPDQEDQLLEQLPLRSLDHRDLPVPGGVATLVEVRATWQARPPAPQLPLLTEFRLADGRIVRRRWTAPAQATTWRGIFALPSPPRAAATAVAR